MAESLPDIYVKLHGLEGECTDSQHPGDEGWIEIKKFSFGFGLKDSAKKKEPKFNPVGPDGQVLTGDKLKKALDEFNRQNNQKTNVSTQDDGPFDTPPVKLDKRLDKTSDSIWREKCHQGKPIPKLEVQACRYGGERSHEKIPFLRIIFGEVVVKSVSLSLGSDQPPEESIEFTYDSVKFQYIWTANDTGSRVRGASAPRAGWNFKANEPFDWPSDDPIE